MVFPVWAWAAFGAFILAMLVLDLFVLHRDAKEISFREAAVLSVFWVALGLLFGILVWVWAGPTTAGEYYAGYVIEKALSVDNVFVFALIFRTSPCPSSTSTGSCFGVWWVPWCCASSSFSSGPSFSRPTTGWSTSSGRS